jgi:hypothetical protein
MPIPRKPDKEVRQMSGPELDKRREMLSTPTFMPAGQAPDGRKSWVVLVNEDGLKRLVNGYNLSQAQYKEIERRINAAILTTIVHCLDMNTRSGRVVNATSIRWCLRVHH